MTAPRFSRLEEVIQDELFPDVDLSLRRGAHVDRNDLASYTFLDEAQPFLETLYLRYGCQLVRADGYFYLLPQGERLGRRHLSTGEMLVGQTLALMLLDPATLRSQGVVTRTQVVQRLAQLVGEERLVTALNPRRKRRDERVAQETVRRELDRALRSLGALGFVTPVGDEELQLRQPVLRFTEAVRGFADPAQALEQLVARGEVTVDLGGADLDEAEDAAP